ncbi:hypothetical protein [Jatrophihabitans fulvus]
MTPSWHGPPRGELGYGAEVTAGTQDERAAARLQVRSGNLLLTLLGGLLVLAAQGGLQWYTVEDGVNVADTGFTRTDLHANATSLDAAVAAAYFGWFGWTLLIVSAAAALLANLPTRLSDPLRVLAFLAGALGLVATYYALAQLFNAQEAAGGADHPVWHNASYGAYAAFGGFLLMTLAGTRGPRRG